MLCRRKKKHRGHFFKLKFSSEYFLNKISEVAIVTVSFAESA